MTTTSGHRIAEKNTKRRGIAPKYWQITQKYSGSSIPLSNSLFKYSLQADNS